MPLQVRARIDRLLGPKRANFWCHVVEGALASFGGELVGAAVVVPVLVAALGAKPTVLGYLTSLGALASLAQVVAAPRVEASRRKKRLVLLLGIGQRVPLLAIAAGLLLWGERNPLACLVTLAVSNLAMGFSVSVLAPPWIDLIAETVPERWVGRLFGFRSAISGLMATASGAACAAVLAGWAFPLNYVSLYLIGFGIMAVSWGLFVLVDELPESAKPRTRQPPRRYFRELLAALKDDRRYRCFMVYQALLRTGRAALPFYAMAAVTHHGMSQSFVAGAFIVAGSVARVAGNAGLPFVCERLGHKRVLAAGVVCHVCAAALAAAAPSGVWYVGVAFLAGLGMAAFSVSGAAFLMRLAPRGRRVGYSALQSVALLPLGLVVPTLAGLVMSCFGHVALFSAAAAVIAAALWPLALIPALAPAGDP